MNVKPLIKHIFVLGYRNKLRSLLLIIGLILSAVIYPILDIISTNLVAKSYTYYQNFPSNAVYIQSGSISNDDIKNLRSIDKDFTYTTMVYSYTKSRIKGYTSNKTDVSLNFFYVNNNFEEFPIPSNDIYNSIEQTEIVAGRSISEIDIKLNRKVILLHESSARFLFHNQSDVLGKKIQIENRQDYFSLYSNSYQNEVFTVIGILKDTPDISRVYKEYSKTKSISVPLYAPKLSSVSDNILIMLAKGQITFDYENEIRNSIIYSNIQTPYVFSFVSIKNELDEQINLIRKSNTFIIIAVYTVCLIFVTTLLLFFVKERVIEIGIRKAVGASEKDIFRQFVFEITLLGAICSIIGTVLGLFFGSLVTFFITASAGTPSCIINSSTIFLPILFIVLVSLIASIIPSIVASKKSIKECLQFE